LCHAREVLVGSGLDKQFAAGEGVEEHGFDLRAGFELQELGDLGHDWSRDDDRLSIAAEEVRAGGVVLVLAVEQGDQ